jgi:hypothetical protein
METIPEYIKLIAPLFGVIIGWFLTSISGLRKERIATKEKLGKAIMNLIYLDVEISKILNQLEFFKQSANGVKEFEKLRKRVFDRYSSKNEDFKNAFESINEIGGLYPLESMKLNSLVKNYLFLQEINLGQTSEASEEKYIYALSTQEAGMISQQILLERIIRRLAFKHSFLLWIKTNIQDSKQSNVAKNLSQMATDLTREQGGRKKEKETKSEEKSL